MTEKSFTLAQLAEMTLLTERTLRTYLRRGLLQGEKTSRGWRFTREQAFALMRSPAVRRAMNANRLARAEDFLHRRMDTAGQTCAVTDIPADEDAAARLMDAALALAAEGGVRMVWHCEGGMARLILRGETARVAEALSAFARAIPEKTP
ncbi:MAG: MerR family transcriptional regulator [Aristaeellaceae bacterium]